MLFLVLKGKPGVGIEQKGLVGAWLVEEGEGVVFGDGEGGEVVGVGDCCEEGRGGCDWGEEQHSDEEEHRLMINISESMLKCCILDSVGYA